MMNESEKEFTKQVNNISQSNEGINQYLSSLEELMRLIAANQLLDNISNKMRKE